MPQATPDPCKERKREEGRATKILQYEGKLNYKDIRKQSQSSKGECETIKDKEKSVFNVVYPWLPGCC